MLPPRELPQVILKSKETYRFWLTLYRDFPKVERFGIGNKIEQAFLDVLEYTFCLTYLPPEHMTRRAPTEAFPVQPQREWEELKRRVVDQGSRLAKILLNNIGLEIAGTELAYKYTSLKARSKNNLVSAIMLVNHEINTRLGKDRSQCSSEDFKAILEPIDMNTAVKIAVHYLLSEFAFLEFAPTYFGVKKVSYVYHRNWLVYEDYISGKFDGLSKSHMDFILLENPYETYNPIWGLEGEEVIYKDVLDRIEKTKILRVGFIQSVPTFMYDKDYKNFSGIFYDIISAIAKKYNWNINWSEETGYGVIAEGLNNDRFDIFGPTVWPTPERLAVASFSISLFKSFVFTYVRADNLKNESELKNDTNMRVVIMENDIMDSIAKADFPNNRQVRVPQLSSNIACAQFVADGRGDFTFREQYLAEYFNTNSEVKLIPASKKPIRVYDNTFMLKKGEARLKEFWDKELDILQRDGTIKSLIKKYTGSEDTFL